MDTNTTRTELATARTDLAELAARVRPIDPRASRADVRELYRLRRLVIDLEAAARKITQTEAAAEYGRLARTV